MASASGEGSPARVDGDYKSLVSTPDVELLKRAWRNEKAAPEILHFQTDLIRRVIGQIQLTVFPQPEKIPKATFVCWNIQ